MLVQGVSRISGMLSTMQKMERWIKRAVAAVFILVGIYYCFIVYGTLLLGT